MVGAPQLWAEPQPETSHDHHYHEEGDDQHRAIERAAREAEHELSQLLTLDQRILELSRKQRETQQKLDELTKLSARYQSEITALNGALKVDRTALMRLLTLQERVKPARVVELLMSADGPLEQKRREVYLSALFKTGARRLKALSLARKSLNARRRALTRLSEQADQLTQLLQTQAESLALERRAEWEAISSRHELKGELERTEDSQSRRTLWDSPTRLPPARGEWIDEFKSFRGLSLAKMYGGGVWIRDVADSPVYCVERGEVLFASLVRGWGYVVIIQHAFSYMSIYANLSRVSVKEGAQVDMQARVGNSGVAAGREGLYFELRRGGEPIHPERWINRELSGFTQRSVQQSVIEGER